jgi:hypothetical protein
MRSMSEYLQRLIRPPVASVVRPGDALVSTASPAPADPSGFGIDTIEQASYEADAARGGEGDCASASRNDAVSPVEIAAPQRMTLDDVVRWVESPRHVPPAPIPPDASNVPKTPAALRDLVVDVSRVTTGPGTASRERATDATTARADPEQKVGAERALGATPAATVHFATSQARVPAPPIELPETKGEFIAPPFADAVPVHRPDATPEHRPSRRADAPTLSAMPAMAPVVTHAPAQPAVEVRIGSIELVVKNARQAPHTPPAPPPNPVSPPLAADTRESVPSADWRFSASRYYLRRS